MQLDWVTFLYHFNRFNHIAVSKCSLTMINPVYENYQQSTGERKSPPVPPKDNGPPCASKSQRTPPVPPKGQLMSLAFVCYHDDDIPSKETIVLDQVGHLLTYN